MLKICENWQYYGKNWRDPALIPGSFPNFSHQYSQLNFHLHSTFGIKWLGENGYHSYRAWNSRLILLLTMEYLLTSEDYSCRHFSTWCLADAKVILLERCYLFRVTSWMNECLKNIGIVVGRPDDRCRSRTIQPSMFIVFRSIIKALIYTHNVHVSINVKNATARSGDQLAIEKEKKSRLDKNDTIHSTRNQVSTHYSWTRVTRRYEDTVEYERWSTSQLSVEMSSDFRNSMSMPGKFVFLRDSASQKEKKIVLQRKDTLGWVLENLREGIGWSVISTLA